MISPELLRRYPIFSLFDHDQLRDLAMITDEITAEAESVLFESGAPADVLYLILVGNVEIYFIVADERGMETVQEFLVGMINPGELLGISALISPFLYTTKAYVTEKSRLLAMNANDLRDLCEDDPLLAAAWYHKIAEATMSRLRDTRIQLLGC